MPSTPLLRQIGCRGGRERRLLRSASAARARGSHHDITLAGRGRRDHLVRVVRHGCAADRTRHVLRSLSRFFVNRYVFTAIPQHLGHPDQFPDAAKYPVLKLIPPGHSMEGLLFPATYNMPVNATAQDAVNRMLTAFNDYVQKYDLVARARANKLNEYQMVILASLIQREIVNNGDAPGVAGVYWNRLMNDVPNDTAGYLGSDPSVQYARDSQNPPSQYWLPLQDAGKNVATNSAWNTYLNQGLPPTPICSPGLVTLQAAASPTMSGYFYFLSTKTGTIVYAKTYQEFQQDVQKYLH